MTRSVWPGSPFPLGPTWDGEGTNFSLFSENAERVELCLFDDDGSEERDRAARAHRVQLARLRPRRRARPALRLPRPRRTTTPSDGSALQPDEAPARPVREGDRRADRLGAANVLPYVPSGDDADLDARRRRRRARDPEVRRRSTRASTGRTTTGPPAHPVARDGHLRGARQGLHEAPSRRARGPARHVRRPRVRAAIEHLTSLGVTAVELLPVHHIADEGFLHDRGLTNYWGYSSIGFLAPHALYSATGRRGEQVREFKGMVKALHRAGHRGDPRRRLQPHRRGEPPRADALVQGHRQPVVLPADAGRPALLHGLHGHRQLAQPGAPVGAAADHGLAALLGDRLPRRRLPLRPRVGARARVLRGRPPLRVLRHHPPGPGALAGEADRGAVGRRAGRLPGRQLPGPLDGVERHLPRHACATSGAPRRACREFASRFTGLERPLPARRPAAVRVDQLHHGARRLHAARSRLVQREAQRGERRGQPGRHRRQPLVELRRRGRRPTIPRSTRCASGSSGTSCRRCCSRRACRCCSAATSSGARRTATTTRGARTTRSRGSTGSATSRSTAARLHAAADPRCAASIRSSGATCFPAGEAAARACPTCGGSGPTGAR